MAEIFLTSEVFVKSVSNISDNVAGKYILPSIREAQEIKLKSILGPCLLSALKLMVGNGTINAAGNEKYKELVDECQYFLAYSAIVELIPKVSYKVGNFGLSKSTDENLQVASSGEIERQQVFYQSKADAEAAQIQEFLLQNRSDFPELKACDCARIQANLRTAASCGIVLGGARGKQALYKKGGCCR